MERPKDYEGGWMKLLRIVYSLAAVVAIACFILYWIDADKMGATVTGAVDIIFDEGTRVYTVYVSPRQDLAVRFISNRT